MGSLMQFVNGFLFFAGGIVAALVMKLLFHISLCN